MEENQNNEFNSVDNSHEINTRNILDNISVTNESTIEIRQEKQIITQKKAYWFLACVFGWVFIFILSVIFGANSIWKFIGSGEIGSQSSLLGFISEVKLEDPNSLDATKYFFQALALSFEALLFVFFIVFSTKMSIKSYVPYSKWYKSTLPLRQKKELDFLKIKQERTKQAAANNGISYKDKIYDFGDVKKEILSRKKDTKSLDKKIKKFNKKKK